MAFTGLALTAVTFGALYFGLCASLGGCGKLASTTDSGLPNEATESIASGPKFSSDRCFIRANWIRPPSFDTAQSRLTTLQKLKLAKLNTVFLAAPQTGLGYGWSNEASFAQFLGELRAENFSVHLWVQNKMRGARSDADEENAQADFESETERTLQVNWITDLLDRYPNLQGVHYDYIRYEDQPAWVGEFSKTEAVSKTISAISSQIRQRYSTKFLSASSFVAEPTYGDFDAEFVSFWFRSWSSWITSAANDSNEINTLFKALANQSASKHSVPTFFKFQQNPVSWLKRNFIDVVVPMQYTTDVHKYQTEISIWKSFFSHQNLSPQRLVMGTGWLPVDTSETSHSDWGYDAVSLETRVQIAKTGTMSNANDAIGGVSIYRIAGYEQEGTEVDDTHAIAALSNSITTLEDALSNNCW